MDQLEEEEEEEGRGRFVFGDTDEVIPISERKDGLVLRYWQKLRDETKGKENEG